jgi:catechol 2,3-dioxygenase-like lactoylglutathione lyase family enzyme
VAAVKRAGTPILTKSGVPVTLKRPDGEVKAVYFRDPDGYIVEAIQVPAAADAPSGNVLGAIMGLTVRDLDESLKFWQEQLGWTFSGGRAFAKDPAMLDLMGLPAGSEYRTLSAVVPGSRARMQITEFKGMPRKPFDLRVPDPGASGMAIRVANIEGLLPKLKKEGVRVVSKDGELVLWSATLRNVFVKDPNGLNIELVGAPSAQAQ